MRAQLRKKTDTSPADRTTRGEINERITPLPAQYSLAPRDHTHSEHSRHCYCLEAFFPARPANPVKVRLISRAPNPSNPASHNVSPSGRHTLSAASQNAHPTLPYPRPLLSRADVGQREVGHVALGAFSLPVSWPSARAILAGSCEKRRVPEVSTFLLTSFQRLESRGTEFHLLALLDFIVLRKPAVILALALAPPPVSHSFNVPVPDKGLLRVLPPAACTPCLDRHRARGEPRGSRETLLQPAPRSTGPGFSSPTVGRSMACLPACLST